MTPKEKQIIIFDTTLRDGEQSPGATMNQAEKLRIAEHLDRMGVDVIEAGFAMASAGDFNAIQAIASMVKQATICSLARAKENDIKAAADALSKARSKRIHTFISTSPIHRKHKLSMSQESVIEAITQSVQYARKWTDDVEWSAEDATRTEIDFLCQAVEAAIKAGASTINLPDTVGYTTPFEYGLLIKTVKERVANSDKVIFSVHCHNDLGLAVANSLAAIDNGARQVECTINGLGERAGNAAMEELVMAIKTRQDQYPYVTNIDSTQIARVSRLVSTVTGFVVQKNKAVVGANAFAHESGIHQDGMLKHTGTYEIMTPESVGFGRSKIVLGKLSGRNAFKTHLKSLHIALDDDELDKAFIRFKHLADKKKHIYDEDIIALIDNNVMKENQTVLLKSLRVSCGSYGEQKAHIVVSIDGEEAACESTGSGPVDALFKAIHSLVPHSSKLELYQVHAVTEGTDAQAEVTVRLKEKCHTVVSGHGRDIDTLVASAKAYISALNKTLQLNNNM